MQKSSNPGDVAEMKPAKYKALDIAKFYIQLAADLGEEMDIEKVNCLVYYAQGWSLTLLGEPLFDDEIIAGDEGPIIPAIYEAFSDQDCNSDEKGSV